MAKIKRAVSPGGALLRSSRLFSLPRAIPDKEIPYELKMENPSSSTRPHPTRQSITSPQTSREKGDWGLKRPLPLKQTLATTTPLLKVKELDSQERITDYGSSADHALTLEKFLELHMSMSVPRPSHSNIERVNTRVRMSAFEESHDFTVAPADDPTRKGWKFRGPWLASMPEGEFEAFIEKKVLPRRVEFQKLMRLKCASEMTLVNNSKARETGEERPPAIQPGDITDEQLGDYMRSLRNQRDKLYSFVTDFLDLPPLQVPVGINEALKLEKPSGPPNMAFDAHGPPPAHPSAGLSYLRTHSFMENHWLYGPQAQKKPVLARLLQPQIYRKGVMLGVGGFVTEAPDGSEMNLKGGGRFQSQRFRGQRQQLKGIHHLDIESHGGAKSWVVPDFAYVDPNGMIVMKVETADTETKLVAREGRGEPLVYNTMKRQTSIERSEKEAARYEQTRYENPEEDKALGRSSFADPVEGKDKIGSASAYGLDEPKH